MGNRARARDLKAIALENGPQGFCPQSPPSVLPDISPARGEITPTAFTAPSADPASGGSPNERLISPLAGEMSGRTEGGISVILKDNSKRESATSSPRPLASGRQPHGPRARLAVRKYRAQTLIAFATQAETLGCTEIRPAPPRSLIVLGLDLEKCLSLQEQAAALGFVTTADDPLTRISACPGKPACASGRYETRDGGAESRRGTARPPGRRSYAACLRMPEGLRPSGAGFDHPCRRRKRHRTCRRRNGAPYAAGLHAAGRVEPKASPLGAADRRSTRRKGKRGGKAGDVGRSQPRRRVSTGHEMKIIRLHPGRQCDLRKVLRDYPRRGRSRPIQPMRRPTSLSA